MSDFPTSLIDFQRRFPDEAACAAYLFEVPMAFRFSLSGLRSSQGLAAWRQALHL